MSVHRVCERASQPVPGSASGNERERRFTCENEPALVHQGRERTACAGSDACPSERARACACGWASVPRASHSGSAGPPAQAVLAGPSTPP